MHDAAHRRLQLNEAVVAGCARGSAGRCAVGVVGCLLGELSADVGRMEECLSEVSGEGGRGACSKALSGWEVCTGRGVLLGPVAVVSRLREAAARVKSATDKGPAHTVLGELSACCSSWFA
jgi:hypothetical protein